MALNTHDTTYRDAMAAAHRADLYTGGTPSFALYAGATLVATLSGPLEATPSSGVITVDNTGTPSVTVGAGLGGTLDSYRRLRGNSTEAYRGTISTVSAGTGDLQLDDVVVNEGDEIQFAPSSLPTWSYPVGVDEGGSGPPLPS